MQDLLKEIGVYIVTGLVAMVAWFLRSKDEFQGKQIALLFVKHEEDAKKLAELEVAIAKEHYPKIEVDTRFQRIEDSIKEGVKDLSAKIDKLADAMMNQHRGGQ